MTLQYEMDRYLDDHKEELKAEGIEEGKALGIEEGMQKGKALGIEEGIVEGAEKAKINFVKSMFAKGISVEAIADIAHITVDNVEEILSAQE